MSLPEIAKNNPAGAIGPPELPGIRAYRGCLLSNESPPIDVPLGNGVIYRLQYVNEDFIRLYFVPMSRPTYVDYKVHSIYDISNHENSQYNNRLLSAAVDIADLIYTGTREMHKSWVRVQNPDTGLWSTYDLSLFASASGGRITVWVAAIEEEVVYE